MATGRDTPGDEGPLAHAARVASDRSYLDGLVETRRSAWERASGARPQRTPKRLLVALSHSIEKAVLGGPIEYPTVVVALFQELRFFDREREVYARMAAAGAIVVVGFADGSGHQLPPGVHGVTLRPDEPLAEEWSVVAVSSGAGAFLVATDQHSFDPSERDHEASREFVGRWGYSRAQASTELARLRFSLGNRLDVVLRGTIDDLLAAYMPTGGDPAASAGTPGETWATTSLGHMMGQMQTARAGTRELREQLADAQAAAAARAAATTDPQSGLANPDFLERWSRPTGPNPLPTGLALFDIGEFDGDVLRNDERAAYFAAHQVAAAVSQPLGPVDAVVRVSAREFLVVVPGASTRHLAGLCDRIGEQLELASRGYPDVPLRARVASTVTRHRPLPVDDLRAALTRLGDGSGPIEGGEVPDGGRIVAASTVIHAGGAGSAGADGRGAASDDTGRPAVDPDPSTRTQDVDGARTADGPDADGAPDAGGSTGSDRAPGTGEVPVRGGIADDVGRPGAVADRPDPVGSSAGASASAASARPTPAPVDAVGPAVPPSVPPSRPGPPTPPRPRPEVSPFGHTGSSGNSGHTGSPGGTGSSAPAGSFGSGPSGPAPERADGTVSQFGRRSAQHARSDDGSSTGPSDGVAPELPHRTAQEALHRLVHGDGAAPGGDPRARSDVFADLSDPPNGHGPRR